MPERKKLFSTGDYALHYINLANGITKIKTLKEAHETYLEWMQTVTRACEATENLEGQGDLVSKLIMVRIRVTMWVIGIINRLYSVASESLARLL